MITVHHLEQSRSMRILWLLEELEVDYTIKLYQRDPETSLAPPELFKIHPLGKSPVIDDDGRVIAETGTIIEYLVGRYGKNQFRPAAQTDDEINYLYWLHFAEGTMMPPMVMSLVLGRIAETPMPFFVKPIAKNIAAKLREVMVDRHLPNHFAMIDKALDGKEFLVGDRLSGADIMMSFPLEAAVTRTDAGTKYPNIANYVKRIQARPAYLAAYEKAGPYDFGPQKS